MRLAALFPVPLAASAKAEPNVKRAPRTPANPENSSWERDAECESVADHDWRLAQTDAIGTPVRGSNDVLNPDCQCNSHRPRAPLPAPSRNVRPPGRGPLRSADLLRHDNQRAVLVSGLTSPPSSDIRPAQSSRRARPRRTPTASPRGNG